MYQMYRTSISTLRILLVRLWEFIPPATWQKVMNFRKTFKQLHCSFANVLTPITPTSEYITACLSFLVKTDLFYLPNIHRFLNPSHLCCWRKLQSRKYHICSDNYTMQHLRADNIASHEINKWNTSNVCLLVGHRVLASWWVKRNIKLLLTLSRQSKVHWCWALKQLSILKLIRLYPLY